MLSSTQLPDVEVTETVVDLLLSRLVTFSLVPAGNSSLDAAGAPPSPERVTVEPGHTTSPSPAGGAADESSDAGGSSEAGGCADPDGSCDADPAPSAGGWSAAGGRPRPHPVPGTARFPLLQPDLFDHGLRLAIRAADWASGLAFWSAMNF